MRAPDSAVSFAAVGVIRLNQSPARKQAENLANGPKPRPRRPFVRGAGRRGDNCLRANPLRIPESAANLREPPCHTAAAMLNNGTEWFTQAVPPTSPANVESRQA